MAQDQAETGGETAAAPAPAPAPSAEETPVVAETQDPVTPHPEADKILKQIDFYFSDENITNDTFLRSKIQADSEGYVDIELLKSFKRMQAFQASIPQIALALKDSKEVQLNQDETKVKRIHDLPGKEDIKWRQRTFYAKGFAKNKEPEIENVEDFFSKFDGKVKMVRIRRYKDRDTVGFKGSIYVTMEDEDQAKKIIEQKDLQYEGHPLILMSFDDHVELKKKEDQEKRDKYKGHKGRKRKNEGDADGDTGGDDAGDKKGDDKSAEEEDAPKEYTKGLVMKLKNIGPGVQRHELKEYFGTFGKVSFVDFEPDNEEAVVRFAEEDIAQVAVKGLEDQKKEFGGKNPSASILEGDEEKEYWDVTWKQIQEAQKRKNDKNRGGGRGGGGRGRGRGRGRGNKRGRN